MKYMGKNYSENKMNYIWKKYAIQFVHDDGIWEIDFNAVNLLHLFVQIDVWRLESEYAPVGYPRIHAIFEVS